MIKNALGTQKRHEELQALFDEDSAQYVGNCYSKQTKKLKD